MTNASALLIIDEGEAHHQRFLAVQRHLSDLQPSQYLRELDAAAPGSQEAALADLADSNYALLLGTLSIVFALGDQGGGSLIEQARRAMYNLHETCHRLASRGVAPRFTLPPDLPAPPPVPDDRAGVAAGSPAAFSRSALGAVLEGFEGSSDAALRALAEGDDPDVRAMAERQRQARDDIVARLRACVLDA